MKPSEFVQVEFIKDCLRKGEQRNEILRKFKKKWENISRSTFDRRLSMAKGALQLEQKIISEEVERQVREAVAIRKSKIMTAIERQEFLTQILTGEIEIPDTDVVWDPVKKKFVTIKMVKLANHADRIRATAELNKMDGSYAPIKTKANVTVNTVGVDALEEKYEQ